MNAQATRRPLLRAFHRPGLWCTLGLLAIAVVVVASLLPADELPSTGFSGADKIGHFLAYAVLSTYATMLLERRRPQALAAIALIGMGIGLEFAQGAMNAARMADTADALANALGVLAGLAAGSTRFARLLQRLDARLA